MTFLEIHCKECMEKLGEPFEKVHRWIDGIEPPREECRPDNRHHDEAIEQIRKMWGDKAARAAEIHILRDTGGRIPTREEVLTWNHDCLRCDILDAHEQSRIVGH